MKKTLFNGLFFTAMLFAFGTTNASAQGFLKKLNKGLEKVSNVVGKGTDVVETVAGTVNEDPASVNWDAIPQYTLQKVYLVDDEGNNVLNEDGTQEYCVFLVDQFGNRRSKEAVQAQNKVITARVAAILVKLSAGTVAGAKGKGLAGALIGAAVGAATSAGDIKMIKKQMESLKAQKKLIESYSQNFTDEGKPIDAKVDLSEVLGVEFNDDNTVSAKTSEIKEQLASDIFNTTDDAWDLDEKEGESTGESK